jgi:hypothetical protein
MALWEGLVRVLVLVNATVMQQAQETIEQVKTQELAVTVRDDGVVVVALKDVEELGKNGQVAGGVLVPHHADERIESEQVVEKIRRAQIERLSLW